MDYIQNIILDLNTSVAYAVVNAKQGDTIRKVQAQIKQNNETYNLDGKIFQYRIRKPDGTSVWINEGCNVLNAEEGLIEFDLVEQAMTAAGRGYGDVQFMNGQGETIATVSFILLVQSAPDISSSVSTNDMRYLTSLINNSQKIIAESKAWAIGKDLNDNPISPDSVEPGEPNSENNAQYWSIQAEAGGNPNRKLMSGYSLSTDSDDSKIYYITSSSDEVWHNNGEWWYNVSKNLFDGTEKIYYNVKNVPNSGVADTIVAAPEDNIKFFYNQVKGMAYGTGSFSSDYTTNNVSYYVAMASSLKDETYNYASSAEDYFNNTIQYAENAAISATSASQVAETITQYVNSAISSAASAQQFASEAQNYSEIAEGYRDNAENYSINASNYADDASNYANNAQNYATEAQTYYNNLSFAITSASNIITESRQWAIGLSSSISDQSPSNTNNARYYKNQSQLWATGSSTGTPSNTNNALYYSNIAKASSNAAVTYASNAQISASSASMYADNALNYKNQAQLWAIGNSSNVEPSDINNAFYYVTVASNYANNTNISMTSAYNYSISAQLSATSAENFKNDAQAYSNLANTTLTNILTVAAEASSNAVMATTAASSAILSATSASSYVDQSWNWVNGKNSELSVASSTNNAYYYAQEAKNAKQSIDNLSIKAHQVYYDIDPFVIKTEETDENGLQYQNYDFNIPSGAPAIISPNSTASLTFGTENNAILNLEEDETAYVRKGVPYYTNSSFNVFRGNTLNLIPIAEIGNNFYRILIQNTSYYVPILYDNRETKETAPVYLANFQLIVKEPAGYENGVISQISLGSAEASVVDHNAILDNLFVNKLIPTPSNNKNFLVYRQNNGTYNIEWVDGQTALSLLPQRDVPAISDETIDEIMEV